MSLEVSSNIRMPAEKSGSLRQERETVKKQGNQLLSDILAQLVYVFDVKRKGDGRPSGSCKAAAPVHWLRIG